MAIGSLTANLMGICGLCADTRVTPMFGVSSLNFGLSSPPSWGRSFGIQRTNEGKPAKWELAAN
jgi:hypothetical protein